MANTSIVTDDEYLSPDEYNSEERDLKSKLEELSKQIGSLQKDKEEAHKYINSMTVKMSDHAALEKEIKRLQVANRDLTSRLQTGDMEYAKLWKEVFPPQKDSQTKTIDTSVSNCTVEKTNELSDKARTDQDRIKELENAVRTLMAKLKEESTNKEKLKKRLDQVREEKNGLNEDTSRKITEYQNKILKAEENLKRMTAKYSVSEKEKEELNKKYDNKKEKLRAKYADLEKLQPEDVMKREELLQESKKKIEEKGIAMGKLNQKVGTLQIEQGKSEEQFKTLKAKHDKLVKKSAGEKDEKTLLQKRLSLLQKEVEAVSAEKDHIKDELQGQLGDLKAELIMQAEEKSRLRLEYEAKVAKLRGELEKSDAECKQKQEDNLDLTKQLKEKKDSEDVTEEKSRLRMEYEAKLAAKEQELATLRVELDNSTEKHGAMTLRIEELEKLVQEQENMKAELIMQAEEKSRLRLEYEAKVAKLRGELEKSDAECKQKQEDNLDLTKQLKKKKDGEDITEEKSRLRLEYEAKHAAKVQEVATLRGELERSVAECKQKQEDILDLTKQLKEMKDSEDVTEEKSRLRMEYEAKLAAKEQELATLRVELDNSTEKHGAMTLRIEELEKLVQEQENMKAATEIEQPVKNLAVQEKETVSKYHNQITVEKILAIATEVGEQHVKDSEVQQTETLPEDQKQITDDNAEKFQSLRVENNQLRMELQKLQQERQEPTGTTVYTRKPDIATSQAMDERNAASLGDELGINSGSIVAEKLSKTKKIIELRIRSVRSGMGKTMIDIVTKGLQNLLKDRLLREKVDLHFKPCQTVEADAEGPLFVLCLAKAIIGTKVNALEGIPGNKDTALIVIHYNETKEPLSLTNIGFRSYGAELRQLGGTIDMTFSGNNGLYECDINNSAVERMTTFLKKF
ncbi:golgin subfamily A member 6-like protein 24 isoform X2 [Argopecten irradians]|uniref:golgin subfamily A member 6-like protein 24 isoform X2 n=1 Tax=Argopecten irradians TaxID=31199 RepID=UPI0037207A4F